MSNRAVESAVASAGYYGRDIDAQRDRISPRDLGERIAMGQVLVGSPDTVFTQIKAIRDALGVGIIDLPVAVQLGEKTLRAIELFGTKVLPRLHEL
jgi:alkanesulfonate monooxygenase SsuD/methylene tetrahydromethanopterin reductase-like flavin-dependent oxidoreductase (luciferase family)